MRTNRLLTMAYTCLVVCLMANGAEWRRLSAKLMTPWGEQIDPENVWQEYPRPQLVRGNWMNLNGLWDYYRRANTVKLTYEKTTTKFIHKILVPFGVESALSGIQEQDLGAVANSTLMYRRTFTLPEDFQGKRILLHFGAVDWQCAVFVNGEQAGEHTGGSDPFTLDITHCLKAEGEQELQVAVYDPSSRGGQPRGKQTTSPSSIWYTSCSGIWQTVWLEAVGEAYVERYEVVPDALNGTVRVRVLANDPTCKFSLIARDGDQIVATSDKVRIGQEVTLTIPEPKLWTPDSPFLYDLDIILCQDNCMECDRARGYFGLRTFSKALVDNQPAFLLNGKPIFMFGPLDQGWWPDGLLTPPSYEAMIYDLQTIKSLGMNMVRKHIKVENDLWYEWCDRNGLIVWQDMPSGSDTGSIGTTAEIQQNFYRECENIVNALKQHPSIGIWVPFNEGWGQDANTGAGHTIRGYLTVRNADADSGRLVNSVSGWTDFEIGDVLDCHSYPSPNANDNPRKERVNVCGEYGGITLMVEGHLWAGSQQTYTQVTNSEEYTQRFNQYTLAVQSLQQSKGLWAAVYTQITDVEQEVNGLLTYDRKVRKVNDEQLASIRARIEQTINNRMATAKSVLSAGDNATNVTWKYTTSNPGEGWEKPDFNDQYWTTGVAGFGQISQSAARLRTNWDTPEIWIRRSFKLTGVSEENLPSLCLRMFYDEDTEVFINGVFAMSITGYNTTYQLFDITEEALQTIDLNGTNTIAIHTLQTTGGQYIDAGFSLRTYKSNTETTIKPMAEVIVPQAVEDPALAYLLTYTTTEADGLHYASSLNGLRWTVLNEQKSVFASPSEEAPLQSPFVYRMEDEEGKAVFHLIHGLEGERGLFHWVSDDLLSWKPVNGSDAKILDAKVQSPEITYDPSTEYYIYHWSGPSGTSFIPRYFRTKDFITYTKPANYFDVTVATKDLHVFPCGAKFVALFSAPGVGLYQVHSKSLTPSVAKFSNQTKLFNSLTTLEAPLTIPTFGGDGWLLAGAMSNERVLFYTATGEPAKLRWRLYEKASYELPTDMKEGKVTIITRSELQQLQQTLNGLETGVHPPMLNASSVPKENAVFNLSGQRMASRLLPPHGVYVSGGKKFLAK